MRILVIDDTQANLDAALQTLNGHSVTLCSTHNEAIELLHRKNDEEALHKLKKQLMEEGIGWEEAYFKAKKETLLPYWDAVLCDLLMPPTNKNQNHPELFINEMPVGWSLALQAAKEGAKLVAVVTATNHHHHPASTMLDAISEHIFIVDGAKMLLTNYERKVELAGTEHACKECNGSEECCQCDGTGVIIEEGKDWGSVLDILIKG
ncbi:MAG: hypothetical protein US57_C0004G0033 [Candidatus Moranbacteria bacterium GW2011_GWC2_37_73]|nr:MAG: hypothetical protein UR95_C0002G0067 [Parcubacteria group bacterium GW2011_GWC1_36_108]KKQ01090.1 MAG: hypothetical protein US09_C0003G0090 [Candidatus Moranbacteria bacterium GW2011_GWD1_36_198]KKQ02492.1 MAG: hypothetical protein US10_C0001G0090 [Candidatus Moranbacteria bacterium GW2011_GWD2_36_198]KKQ40150.1 MAG: hypothetical protein US57_C0004G0033 [Candidatus Moranbacteria bacterium GW2011_GWC2_37_73]HAS00039.1 hypothetical protein [Candidatus Moranbacteria bacterium]